ncbi:MAG: carbon-phosphorus lyase complex subunit PhnI [Desulfobacterales bacterium]|jgi:alpha-D-ribose 1-methylphosphonate 5-triphosphate synthase subunit PhnI
MGYVGVKGGKDAIINAESLVEYYRCRSGGTPIDVGQIENQMRLLVDKVISEGSLYSKEIAAIALKQTEGDPMEAAYLVRAFRSTVPRVAFSIPAKSEEMFCIRRISSSFQDIPWGQVLGPSRDYVQRLIRFELKNEKTFTVDPPKKKDNYPLEKPVEKVIDYLRRQGLMAAAGKKPDQVPYDITRQPMVFPLDRSARLQRLTRGEDGAVLALGYASLRGWGSVHPTLAEIRVGYLPVKIKHPYWETEVVIGNVMATEVDSICSFTKTSDPKTGVSSYEFTLGYGLVWGHNERKAIAMSILDRALCTEDPKSPVEDQEFVLYHIDGMESQGFISHLKLPHYVSFQSALDRIRSIQQKMRQKTAQNLKEAVYV